MTAVTRWWHVFLLLPSDTHINPLLCHLNPLYPDRVRLVNSFISLSACMQCCETELYHQGWQKFTGYLITQIILICRARGTAGWHPSSFRNGLKAFRSFLAPLHHPGIFSLYC
jgi:hypothetical protein